MSPRRPFQQQQSEFKMLSLHGSMNSVSSNIVITDFAQSRQALPVFGTIVSIMIKLSILLLVLCLFKCCFGRYLIGGTVDLETVDHEAVDRLEHKLFPYRHSKYPAYKNNEIRRLAIEKDPYDNNTVVCSFCKKLNTCSVLNNKLIEEVYLPKDTSAQETCNVIEKLGQRVSKEIFGHGRTFRDTDQCRGMTTFSLRSILFVCSSLLLFYHTELI